MSRKMRYEMILFSYFDKIPYQLIFLFNWKSVETKPADEWLDAEFKPFGPPEENLTSAFFGPKYTASKLYNNCSPEVH